MKKAVLVLVLTLTPACAATRALFGGPTAPAATDEQINADAQAAGAAVTMLTGNPAIGAGVAAVVGLAGFFLGKRKKAAEPSVAKPS